MSDADPNSNPPLFPQFHQVGDVSEAVGGATLRDYFAGQALATILANRLQVPEATDPVAVVARDTATLAYKIADAMLAARSTEPVTTESTVELVVCPRCSTEALCRQDNHCDLVSNGYR